MLYNNMFHNWMQSKLWHFWSSAFYVGKNKQDIPKEAKEKKSHQLFSIFSPHLYELGTQ